MKLLLSKSMTFIGVFLLLMGAMTTLGINPSYADNLEVIGNEIGLEVNPSNTKLFNLTNMNPGDTREAKMDIKNILDCKFELFLQTERISQIPLEDEADLFKQMILTIYYSGELIYSGSMEVFAKENISLGYLYPGNEKELKAIVHLPGPETGNEFQGKSAQVKWIFMAEQRCDKPDKPDVPEEPKEPNKPEQSDKPDKPSIPNDIDNPQDLGNPKNSDEIIDVVEIIEEVIPEEVPIAYPSLPKTGLIPSTMYYIIGGILLSIGLKGRNKD